MTTTTTRPDTFAAYMADVSRHVSALLDSAMSVNDIADYLYADAFADGVPARDCALAAVLADDIAGPYYAYTQRIAQRTTGTTEQRTTTDHGKESSRQTTYFWMPTLSDVLKDHRPSIRNFKGNLSAPDEFITDGRILLLTEHIRTPGRVRKYRDRHPVSREHRSVPYDNVSIVIPDYTNFVPASYFGCATREGGTSLVFKVDESRQYVCLDADLYSIIADVYGTVPVPEVLVDPTHPTTGPAVYLPYWYNRGIYGLIMPVRHRIEHPQLSN